MATVQHVPSKKIEADFLKTKRLQDFRVDPNRPAAGAAATGEGQPYRDGPNSASRPNPGARPNPGPLMSEETRQQQSSGQSEEAEVTNVGLTREYLRGKYHCTIDLLFDTFGISCMITDNFCFYLQNRLIQTSLTGGQGYNDTSSFSIP